MIEIVKLHIVGKSNENDMFVNIVNQRNYNFIPTLQFLLFSQWSVKRPLRLMTAAICHLIELWLRQ